jgi:predicted kinase
MPASGKSTLARALTAELKLLLVSKDDIKERLYEELGTGAQAGHADSAAPPTH